MAPTPARVPHESDVVLNENGNPAVVDVLSVLEWVYI
jgi:hypothetical protein